MDAICISVSNQVPNIHNGSTSSLDNQFKESTSMLDTTTLLVDTLGAFGKGRNVGNPVDGEETVLIEASGMVLYHLL